MTENGGHGREAKLNRGIRILAIILSIQVIVIGVRSALSFHNAVLEVGEEISFPLFENGEPVKQMDQTCTIAFVCATGCAHCSILAAEFSEATEPPTWIITGGPDDAEAFREEHGLTHQKVLSLSLRKRNLMALDRFLTIPLTPLRLILDQDLTVLDVSAERQLLDEKTLSDICGNPTGAGDR